MLLCRGIPAQHSKALSCWWQVETARRDWKGKSYADVNLDRMNVSSIYALHLTTNVYIYIYIYMCVCAGEEAGARNLAFFRVKWLQPAMKSSSCVCGGCGWDRSDGFFCRTVTVASSCFGCVCVCAVIGCFGICGCRSQWHACFVAMCVDTCGFATSCCKTHCNCCMNVAW